jgi:hypothetical protein
MILIAFLCRTSSKAARIREFIDTEQVPDLTAAEIQAIDDAGSTLIKRHYNWGGEFKD